MHTYRRTFNATLLLLVVGCVVAASSPALADRPTAADLETRATPDGVAYTIWNRPKDGPAPTLIILSGLKVDSMLKRNFLKAGEYLAPLGYVCVSIDLPCHGEFAEPGYSNLTGWSKRAAEGHDFIAEFNARMKDVMDHLIAEGVADPEKIAVTGTSRGGFMAYRYMAFDERVKCAAGYSPVTDLRQLKEFSVAADVPIVDAMSIHAYVGQLVGRPVFLMIGDRDDRVGTDAAIAFMRQLNAAEAEAGKGTDHMLIVRAEPRGHSAPLQMAELAARWIYFQFEGEHLTLTKK